jgi:hypothetical protein
MPKDPRAVNAFGTDFAEIRPGVCKWNQDWPTEVKARMFMAAKARGVWPTVLLRAIAIDWLNAHALVPQAPMEVSPAAADVAHSPAKGNAAMEAHYGPSGARSIGAVFGFEPSELVK